MTFLKVIEKYSVMLSGEYWIVLKVFLILSFAQSLFFKQKKYTQHCITRLVSLFILDTMMRMLKTLSCETLGLWTGWSSMHLPLSPSTFVPI